MAANVRATSGGGVSVLFNEPKLLKKSAPATSDQRSASFSALQRAEIAEKPTAARLDEPQTRFSALQRAEIAENFAAVRSDARHAPFQCSSTSRNC